MSTLRALSFVLGTFCCLTANAGARQCEDATSCVTTDSWHLAVALGAGVRLSPLVDGDNFPLVVLPDLAYYGKQFYWDNTEVGYQWYNNDTWSIETFIKVNSERTLFSVWNVDNFLAATLDSSESVVEDGSGDFMGLIGGGARLVQPPEEELTLSSDYISIEQVAKRDWAYDAGVRLHVYHDDAEWTFALYNDLSSTYSGKHAEVGYKFGFNWGQWHINPTLSLAWKSSELTNYYYGLDARDGVFPFQFYSGKSGWQPGVKVVASKPINSEWSWLVIASYQQLHRGMRRSPLVRRNNIVSAFAGVSYRF
ncbi:MipA/OmpV family protein [Alteromonas sp. a30]|uniref:MipA/OmpV family protein n=1 Tax=Alteromonas sp. a30 TaxID=2730917 RepID=UPI00227E580C|nr:MipA/OmpV family protein [Alteromonas sp. a30]MCY7294706.1 MipA/OmpV family protein [Alteromonas sp. a30]